MQTSMHGPSAESFTCPAMRATRDYAALWLRLSPTKRNVLALSALLTGRASACSLSSTKNPSFPITEKQMTAWQKLPTLIQKILSSTTGTRTCGSSQAGTSPGLTITSSMFHLEHMSSSGLTAWCMERSGSGFRCSKATQRITSLAWKRYRLLMVRDGRTVGMELPWPFYQTVIPMKPPHWLLPTCIARTMVRAGLIGSLSRWPCSGCESLSQHQWWTSSLRDTPPFPLYGSTMTWCWPLRSD